MARIMKSPRKNVKNYWSILQKKAGQYQQLILYAISQAVDDGTLTDEELIKKLLPNKVIQKYPSITVTNKQIVCTPNIELTPDRQNIVDTILQSKKSNANKGRLISGIYAEQRMYDEIKKFLASKEEINLMELAEQITQWDFSITIPIPDIIKKSNASQNILGVLEKYGLIIDYKPDAYNFEVTTNSEYDISQDIWDDLDKSPKGLEKSLIERILYEKYYAFQPIFYSNKGQQKVLLPKDFFSNPNNFGIKLTMGQDKVEKEDYVNAGYTTEELMSFTEEERKQATTYVVEQVLKKRIKAYVINYAKNS